MSLDQMVDLEFAERLEPPIGGNVEFVPTGEHESAGDHPQLFTIADRVDVADKHMRVLSAIKATRPATSMLCTLSDSMCPAACRGREPRRAGAK